MKKPKKQTTPVRMLMFGFAGGFLGIFSSSMLVEMRTQQFVEQTVTRAGVPMGVFAEVYERIQTDYVDEVDPEILIEAAVTGMLTSLDTYSAYLPPADFSDIQEHTRGSFGGIGIEVTLEEGRMKIVTPLEGTPAFRAGLMPGDIITQIEGEDLTGLDLTDMVDRMRGGLGTLVHLTVYRDEENPALDFVIGREVIEVKAARGELLGDIGWIWLSTFNAQSPKALEDLVDRLWKEAGTAGLSGLVLDLRNNPGGLLDQSIAVADLFLDEGRIVSTRGRYGIVQGEMSAYKGDVMRGRPIVVLINKGSASASEIVAGALRDNGRALVVGETSFGKGTVQSIIPLPGSGAMRMTTARYYTPSGASIHEVGIVPDVVVKAAVAPAAGALEGAGNGGAGGGGEDGTQGAGAETTMVVGPAIPTMEEGLKDWDREMLRARDPQLAKSLDILQGLEEIEKTP